MGTNNRGAEHKKVLMVVMVGLMAALVAVGSWLRITMPISVGGTTSFHLGNIMCALSGILLGPVGGGLASGLGSAIYDMTNPLYISECWITFLSKGALGAVTGLVAWSGGKAGRLYRRNLLGAVCGSLTYVVLHLLKTFLWNGLLLGKLEPMGALLLVPGKIPGDTFNAVLAIVCAPPLAMAIQAALKRAGILDRLR